MKLAGFVCICMLVTVSMYVAEAAGLQDKIDQQLFDSLRNENAPRDKRPFCNAFTGCGKKRSFYPSDNSLDNRDESSDRLRIPVPIYRALLRAASQEVRDSVGRETSGENAISELAIDYPAYLARKMQSRDRYQS